MQRPPPHSSTGFQVSPFNPTPRSVGGLGGKGSALISSSLKPQTLQACYNEHDLRMFWMLSSICLPKSHLSHDTVSHSRAGPMPLDAFLCSLLAGSVRNTWLFFITLSAKLIEMRLLISSLGLHLQLNGWRCLGYGLINKFGKHELRIYDESDTVLSTDSPEMSGRSRLSKSSQSSKRWACANRYL